MLTTVTTKTEGKIWPYLQMMRPANIVTAWADIAVGVAIAGLPLLWRSTVATPELLLQLLPQLLPQLLSQLLSESLPQLLPLVWLLLATTGLYGGGVVFNDIFDAELDRLERPERPIPSGRSDFNYSILLGAGLLIGGIMAAAQVSLLSAQVAAAVAMLALVYDAIGKHHRFFGPLNMGLCRGGNWLLGMTILPVIKPDAIVIVLPTIYIAAITVMSRGEVNGGDRRSSLTALSLLLGLLLCLIGLTYFPACNWRSLVPLALVWLALVLPAFIRATQTPSPELIRLAVRSGVIGLIALDAAIVAGFSDWRYGLGVLALLPLSRWLASWFAVT
jgi:4-hydroxybenzoate polyprenyltransferase